LLQSGQDTGLLQDSIPVGEQSKERPAIIQEAAVRTRTAIDFRSTLSAVFYLGAKVRIFRGNKKGENRKGVSYRYIGKG
jgi:hypothetical protein